MSSHVVGTPPSSPGFSPFHKISELLPPQGLHTTCSLCLEHSPPLYPTTYLASSPSSSRNQFGYTSQPPTQMGAPLPSITASCIFPSECLSQL